MQSTIREQLRDLITAAAGTAAFDLIVPERDAFGHYSTNAAMRLAKEVRKNPLVLAKEVSEAIRKAAPAGLLEKVEAAPPGFVNLWVTKEALQGEFAAIAGDERYGLGDSLKGKTVMVEYTDPNPFKLFHIGHLMSNAIGESFARLYEAAGAKVIRANYQGDVGLHVAMSIWAMHHVLPDLPKDGAPLAEKVAYLGKAYAAGAKEYHGFDKLTAGTAEEPNPQKTDLSADLSAKALLRPSEAFGEGGASAEAPKGGAKAEIEAVNEKVYARSDEKVNRLYDTGRRWSMEYFEDIYRRLGTKFDVYFPESEVGAAGMEVIAAHPDVFVKSEGAVVFRGDEHGFHTRVFVNSRGLPTYEAKELGLNKKKFELYPLDLSIIVTGNEIAEYFKVLMKAMELVMPDVARKTRHVPHGMLRLPTGKMSSRTGEVVTAEALIGQAKEQMKKKESKQAGLSPAEREANREAIAIGAIKYSILRQSPGQDIIFDFDTSLSIEGDSGPYLQYAFARLRSIIRKAGEANGKWPSYAGASAGRQRIEDSGKGMEEGKFHSLNSEPELALIRKLLEFPVVVEHCAAALAASGLATYLHALAVAGNRFYEAEPILADENEDRRAARLALVAVTARVLKCGLGLLGIAAIDRM
jgi:arginyl-tRNA synthetase